MLIDDRKQCESAAPELDVPVAASLLARASRRKLPALLFAARDGVRASEPDARDLEIGDPCCAAGFVRPRMEQASQHGSSQGVPALAAAIVIFGGDTR